jgi:hypothetical protein
MTRREQRGSSLIFALIFVMIFGLAISATLDYADTSFKQDNANRSARDAYSGADAATQTLINAMRKQVAWGRAGSSCNGLTYTLPDGRTATVSCAPEAGSGATIAGNAGATVGKQGYPLMTDAPVIVPATSSEPGVTVKGVGTMQVKGGITLHTTSFDVQNAASWYSLTSGWVRTDGYGNHVLPSCTCLNYGGTFAGTIIPGYVQAAPFNIAPVVRTAPVCPGSNKYLALLPGSYTDATALSALTNGGCPGLVLHLLPGNFYFGFTQTGAAAKWLISDSTVDVIGGTPKGWTAGAWSSRPVLPTLGACRTGYDPAPSSGVTLVFGAQSQLAVTASHNVELCSLPAPIPGGGTGFAEGIFGLSSAITGGAAQSGCVIQTPAAGGCPFVSVSGTGVLNVEGIVQSTNGNVTFDYTNGAAPVLWWGALVRSFTVQGLTAGQTVTPVSDESGVPVSASGSTDRYVVLTTTIGGVQYVRARVQFVDANGDTPGSRIKILEWSASK